MKILIAIMSCKRDRSYHKRVRDTWLKNCSVDHRFFLGRGSLKPFSDDEILTEAPDEYSNNSQKVEKAIRFAFESGYDFMFKCDVDSYVCVPRLLRSDYAAHDLYGGLYGGSGYWLSRKAMGYLVSYGNHRDNFSEDWWVRECMSGQGIPAVADTRYWSATKEGPTPQNDIITVHCCSEPQMRPDGRIHDRALSFQERLDLFPKYFNAAKDIQ